MGVVLGGIAGAVAAGDDRELRMVGLLLFGLGGGALGAAVGSMIGTYKAPQCGDVPQAEDFEMLSPETSDE